MSNRLVTYGLIIWTSLWIITNFSSTSLVMHSSFYSNDAWIIFSKEALFSHRSFAAAILFTFKKKKSLKILRLHLESVLHTAMLEGYKKNPCFLALYKMYVRTFKTTWEVFQEEEIENKGSFLIDEIFIGPNWLISPNCWKDNSPTKLVD